MKRRLRNPPPSRASARFAAWCDWTDLSQQDVADRLGCTQGHLNHLLQGRRNKRPGLDLAHAIERATRDWPEGPILVTEWLASNASPEANPSPKRRTG